METFFSVIIPLYNKEKFILNTLNSVFSQSFSNFEVIVVNDGSSDNSLNIVKGFNYPNIRIVTQSNAGVSAARNKGIALSQGHWIAFLDADDIWSSSHLENLFFAISNHPEVWMVSSRSARINHIKSVENIFTNTEKPTSKLINYFQEAQDNIGVVNSSNVAIKRHFFEQNDGFKSYQRGEDLELWARVAFNYPAALSGNITSFYVQDTSGVMHSGYWSIEPPTSVNSVRLEDFSPSAASMVSLLDDTTSSDVVDYINVRIMNHIRINCIQVNAELARKMSSFLIRPVRYKKLIFVFYVNIVRMPISFVNALYFVRRKLILWLKK